MTVGIEINGEYIMSPTAINLTAMWLVWSCIVVIWVPIRFVVGLFVDRKPFRGFVNVFYLALICAGIHIAVVVLINLSG